LFVVLPDKAAPRPFKVPDSCTKRALATLMFVFGAGFGFRFSDTGMALAGLGSRVMAKAKDAEPKASPHRIDEIRRNCEDLTI
jgi:hypothetical protein